MGICCTGKLTKSEYRHDDIRIHLRNNQPSQLNPDPKLTTDTEKTLLNTLINSLITEYLQINLKYKLSKMNFDQLYNISLQYKHDFTSCNYLICDLRSFPVDTPLPSHNFLTKFKQINYTLNELQILSSLKRNNFKTFLHNKTIIFILNETSLEQCQKYISYFECENINIEKIIILDSSLEIDNKGDIPSEKELLMYYLNDWRIVDYLPMILLSLKYFPHIGSSKYVFMERIYKDTNSKFTPEFLGNPKEIDSHCENNGIYNQFCTEFNIGIIFKLNKGIFTSIQTKEFKRKSKNMNCIIGQCSLIEMEIDSFNVDEILENKSSIMNIMSKFKNALIENEQCLLIQVDNEIDISVLYRFVYLFINFITNIPCCKINEYLLMNKCSIFLEENDYYKQNSNELEQIINTCKE